VDVGRQAPGPTVFGSGISLYSPLVRHTGGRDSASALVIVPTYNERESISELILRVLASARSPVELLVVDDSSSDGTATLVKELAAESDKIHLLERASKQGLGTAYITGFRWAIQRGYWAVVEIDGDLSHDPAVVPDLLDALASADLAIGSRYVADGRVCNWGRVRRALSRAGNVYARCWLGFGIRDSTSGFRAYRMDALAALDLARVRSEGYAFQIELTRRIHNECGRIVEIPITFVERSSGRSKISYGIVVEALVYTAAWGLKDRLRRASFAGRRLRTQDRRP
jgi:dolichol-phosphate mannosyltransferase